MSTSTFSNGSCASNSDATGRQSNGFQFGGKSWWSHRLRQFVVSEVQ